MLDLSKVRHINKMKQINKKMLSILQNTNSKLKQMRTQPVAKYFLVACAKYGFVRGVSISKYDINKRERLLVDRIAWGALYSGIYTWGHPYVVYRAVKWLERKTREKEEKEFAPSLDELLYYYIVLKMCHYSKA
jgi:hypothetical protein